MFRSMEDEMNQLARAFGMPAMPSLTTTSLWDELPAAAAQWPTTAKVSPCGPPPPARALCARAD